MAASSSANHTSNASSSDELLLPRIGLGTWLAPPGVIGAAVTQAIQCGYRLIDCAAAYRNQAEIGRAVQQVLDDDSGLQRSDLCIISKIFNTHHVWKKGDEEEDRPRESLLQTLEELRLTYLDVLLIHWPIGFAQKDIDLSKLRDETGRPNPEFIMEVEFVETWKSMERLQREGLVKHIGVSNFTAAQIDTLIESCTVRPALNQVELHPYLQQPELLAYCKSKGIQVMAYSPLGSRESYSGTTFPAAMKTTLLENPVVLELANAHRRSPAQVLLKWSLQTGCIPIPKSTHPERMVQNLAAAAEDFKLSDEQMQRLAMLDCNFRFSIGYVPGHYDCPNAPWWKEPDPIKNEDEED